MRVALFLLLALAAGSASAAESFRAASGLVPLVMEGSELHPSLVTRAIDDVRYLPRSVLHRNPQHSSDPEFVRAVARSGSQGNLDGEGLDSALYAFYALYALYALSPGEGEVGLYGLEAASTADADRREAAVRKIWAHNARLNRARVHRQGLILVVVWADGLSPEAWEAVNAALADRLIAP